MIHYWRERCCCIWLRKLKLTATYLWSDGLPPRISKHWIKASILVVVLIVLVACKPASQAPVPAETANPTAFAPRSTAISSSSPSVTSLPPTTTASPTTAPTLDQDCFQVEFVEDVTIRDGAPMRPGEIFLKVWRLVNSGPCTWEGTLLLVFEKGERMRSPDETPATLYSAGSELDLALGEREWVESRVFQVEPGQNVNLAVVLQAPFEPGFHRAYFLLLDPFGQKMDQLYVVIEVMEEPPPGDWSGVWGHRMPSFLEDEGARLFLDQSGQDLMGFFYLQDGRLLLLSGLISEDGLFASGLWGEPWTDGSQFEWSLTQPDVFQGSFLSTSMPEGDWCAARGEMTLGPEGCLLNEP